MTHDDASVETGVGGQAKAGHLKVQALDIGQEIIFLILYD